MLKLENTLIKVIISYRKCFVNILKKIKIKKVSENPYKALSEVEMLEKLAKAREHVSQGMYKDASDVSRDMRAKYGL